jgi:NAD-dependent dihydropyrimidine dehydrogenase PreA subunit
MILPHLILSTSYLRVPSTNDSRRTTSDALNFVRRQSEFTAPHVKYAFFDFGICYGQHGQDFVEVHHLKPISTLGKSTPVNPETDMTVLCANCHRMVHRDPGKPLTVDDLKKILSMNRRDG